MASEITTIKIGRKTKFGLDKYREHKNESYDSILKKVLYLLKFLKKSPELSIKTVNEIEAARKRIKAGEFYTEAEAKKILGLE